MIVVAVFMYFVFSFKCLKIILINLKLVVIYLKRKKIVVIVFSLKNN